MLAATLEFEGVTPLELIEMLDRLWVAACRLGYALEREHPELVDLGGEA